MSEYLMIGQVLKPQGIRGEVKVKPETDNPARFNVLSEVYVGAGSKKNHVSVSDVRVRAGYVYLRLDGATSRDEAEQQRGWLLYVDRAHAVELPEGRHFIVDLIGCTAKDTSGKVIGIVTEVLQPGANDIYVIAAQGGTWLVPALKKVVLEVDTAQKTMTLDTALFPEVDVFEN